MFVFEISNPKLLETFGFQFCRKHLSIEYDIILLDNILVQAGVVSEIRCHECPQNFALGDTLFIDKENKLKYCSKCMKKRFNIAHGTNY